MKKETNSVARYTKSKRRNTIFIVMYVAVKLLMSPVGFVLNDDAITRLPAFKIAREITQSMNEFKGDKIVF